MRKLENLRYPALALVAFVLILYFALPTIRSNEALPRPQQTIQKTYRWDKDREAVIKDAFRHAWTGYLRHAFPDDALRPLTQSSVTTRSSWGVTVFDGLSTAIMMDMPEVVEPMLKHIETITFPGSNASVSLFGTTIRYLGGLLSAYELLTSSTTVPQIDAVSDQANMLLRQAQSLAGALEFAYKTPSGLPQNNLKFGPKPSHKRTPVTDITAATNPALEFFCLSQLTPSMVSDVAVAALDKVLALSLPGMTPFPGLSGRFLDLRAGVLADAAGGWYGGAGGFYEYLLKLTLLSPKHFWYCLDRWILAADSTITYLASSPSSRPDLVFLASFNGTELLYNTDHTAHFAAANFLLGGSILREQKYTDFGLKLVDAQIEMYKATSTGLGPDQYAWLPNYCHNLHGYTDTHDPGNTRSAPAACTIPETFQNQSSFYASAGFYNTSPGFKLRPEVLESLYYAYRMTGDTKYQNASWSIFQKILEHTMIESGGFAGLRDVNIVPDKEAAVASKGQNGGMEDLQYSYMLAETIMYAWLIQTDGDLPWHVQADGQNTWVFNTEGHPLRIIESPGS